MVQHHPSSTCLSDEAGDFAFLPDRKRAASQLGRVLVLGLGKSGKSVARYCADMLGGRVESLFIAAGARNDDSAAFVESLADRGVDYAFGDDALDGDLGRFDVCIASPGIPYWHDLYVRGTELSGELISEVEFAWRESAADSIWVAITGTNGKTTTTSLTAHVLKECGFAADAVGNIGDVCLDAVAAGKTQVYVAEVSSYQLYSTRFFAPDVAVMLNITPDHIHWHKTLEAYADAKFKLIDNMGRRGENLLRSAEAPARRTGGAAAELARCARSDSPRSRSALTSSQPQMPSSGPLPNADGLPVAILDATNDVVRAKVRELKALGAEERGFSYIPMGASDGMHGDMRAKCGAENAAFIDGEGRLRVALGGCEHALAKVDDLQIQGEHNAGNALAAGAIAVALGAPDQEIARAQASFKPLEHRIEPCGTVSGVACYNDSKATNTDATVKALQAFPCKRLVIMLGGDDKGTDLAELVKEVYAHAAVAVCFGAAAERFMQALEQDAPADVDASQLVRVHAGNMEDALDKALAQAHSGDVVLLSPACASFDEFTSFEQRGEVFKKLVSVRAEACAQACAQACTQAYAQACATTNNQIDARKTDKEA